MFICGNFMTKYCKYILSCCVIIYIGINNVLGQIYAQDDRKGKEPAFTSGEQLDYVVSYKIGFINVDVATVNFSVTNATVNGEDTFHVKAIGQVRPQYTWFYNLYDVYDVWLEKSTLRPVYFENDLREGDYRYKSNYVYDWNNMLAKTKSYYLSRGTEREKIFPITELSYDAVALFFNMRSINLDKNIEGVPYPLEVVFADTVRKIQYRFMGREEKNIKGIGKFKALKYVCQLANASGDSFIDGSEFTIWISDDRNRIPIYVESPIRVGSVRVRLSAYSGLKYSLKLK